MGLLLLLDVLEAGVELLLPFFPSLLHELEVFSHLRKLFSEQFRALFVLFDCGFFRH
jgi:hypothetical protein